MDALALNVITDLLFRNNIHIFVIEKDKDMETSIIRIGNSRGIIIPASILKKMGVDEDTKVQLEEKGKGELSLRFVSNEEPFTGPFTGPFKALRDLVDEDAWGGKEMDPAEYVRQLRDDSKAEKRELPEW
jgi:bifunctional DNA-binding transcriptional regulator/antitoxin component of YhaV-PrlF toxin-antitoxin module